MFQKVCAGELHDLADSRCSVTSAIKPCMLPVQRSRCVQGSCPQQCRYPLHVAIYADARCLEATDSHADTHCLCCCIFFGSNRQQHWS